MEQGWDPEVKHFLRKVLSSITYGLIWLIACAAGIYYHLAYWSGHPDWYNIVFYLAILGGLGWLLKYYYTTWKE